MKKKILIVTSSLVMGGLEKCLVSMADNFDYDRYEVDLYLFNEGRALLPMLNKKVNLLPDSPYYADFYNRGVLQSVLTLLRKGKFGLAMHRIGRFFRTRAGKTAMTAKEFAVMQKTMLRIDKEYDVAIAFEEGSACHYVAECVNAKCKLGWIQTDIAKINSCHELDDRAFGIMNHVVTVSQNGLNSLCAAFPHHSDKFINIPTPAIMDYADIEKKANEPNNYFGSGKRILSIGRLVELKGFHLCARAMRMLLDHGYDARWFIAGEGDFRPELERLIEELELKDRFVLLGNCPNPYTYIKGADVCVQASSYEGFSMVVYEEKYFKKPVVVSDIPSLHELIENGVNGMIVPREPEEIFKAVKTLLDDEDLMTRMGNAPVKRDLNNAKIMKQVEDLFEC